VKGPCGPLLYYTTYSTVQYCRNGPLVRGPGWRPVWSTVFLYQGPLLRGPKVAVALPLCICIPDLSKTYA